MNLQACTQNHSNGFVISGVCGEHVSGQLYVTQFELQVSPKFFPLTWTGVQLYILRVTLSKTLITDERNTFTKSYNEDQNFYFFQKTLRVIT